MIRTLGIGVAALVLALAPGCRKRADAGRGSPAAAPSDRFADGQRLKAVLEDWRKRWRSELVPPSCADLLTRPEEQRLCAEASEAFGRVKTRAEALDQSNDALHDTAELARRAGRAADKLRYRKMEYMGTEGLSLAAPGASASGTPRPGPSASAAPKPGAVPKPSASGEPDDGDAPAGVRRDDPYQPVLRAYAKLEVEALRYLGAFLELGPLSLRQRAFAELETLWDEAPRPSHPLRQIVRQASLLEADPSFKERLRKLDAKSRVVPKAPSAR